MKNKINNIIDKIPNTIIPFLYLQPFLDILSSFLIKENILTSLTACIRLLFMFIMLLYIFFHKYEHKKTYVTYTILLIINIIIHSLITIYYKDTSVLFYEIKTTLSTYFFIFMLLSFNIIYKEKQINTKHLRNIYIIYLLLTFIPNILNIGFDSYWHSKVGSTGWFYSANVLGSILVILLPLIIKDIKKMNIFLIIPIILISIYVYFSIGTKTPVIGLLILIITNMLYLLYKIIKEKKKKILIIMTSSLIIITTLIIILVPKTNFYKNLNIHYDYLKEQNMQIMSKEFLDNFVFSERLTFESITRKNYKNARFLEKTFGIGYIENYKTENVRNKMIEIDYFDILYREGIMGFILYFLPIIYITYEFIKKHKNNYDKYNKAVLLLIILSLAFFQGHIFIVPAISIYVAIILANITKESEVE